LLRGETVGVGLLRARLGKEEFGQANLDADVFLGLD
jgi:hypothetical protein